MTDLTSKLRKGFGPHDKDAASYDDLVRAAALIEALQAALAEQVAECFDETCQMCSRHEIILRSVQ